MVWIFLTVLAGIGIICYFVMKPEGTNIANEVKCEDVTFKPEDHYTKYVMEDDGTIVYSNKHININV